MTAKKKEKKRRRRNKIALGAIPAEIAADPELAKYWAQRYRLFSRFDEGIKLDRGVFSTKCADLVVQDVSKTVALLAVYYCFSYKRSIAECAFAPLYKFHPPASRRTEVLDFSRASSMGHPCLH